MSTSSRCMSVLLIVLLMWLAIPHATPAYAQGPVYSPDGLLRYLKYQHWSTSPVAGVKPIVKTFVVKFSGDPEDLLDLWSRGMRSVGPAWQSAGAWMIRVQTRLWDIEKVVGGGGGGIGVVVPPAKHMNEAEARAVIGLTIQRNTSLTAAYARCKQRPYAPTTACKTFVANPCAATFARDWRLAHQAGRMLNQCKMW